MNPLRNNTGFKTDPSLFGNGNRSQGNPICRPRDPDIFNPADTLETASLEEALGTIRPSSLQVAIIYEQPADGACAKRFADQFAAEVDDEPETSLALGVWNFKVLGIPEIANLAALAAAGADLVIFSMSGVNGLPRHMEDWIEMWAGRIAQGHPAVVMLFADPISESSPTHADLRRTVMHKGLDCFLQTDRGIVGIRQDRQLSTMGHKGG